MSAKVQRRKDLELTSAVAQVQSPWFHLGGNPWDVQFTLAPGSLCGMEGSNDKLNFETMTDMFNQPIDGKGATMHVGLERPKWLRFFLELDGSQPRLFAATISVGKEQGG